MFSQTFNAQGHDPEDLPGMEKSFKYHIFNTATGLAEVMVWLALVPLSFTARLSS